MANNLYDKGREAFLRGQINWLTDVIKVALIGLPPGSNANPYIAKTSGTDSHQFLSSIPSENILAIQTLVRVLDSAAPRNDAENGVANANDVTFTGVSGSISAIVVYKDTGSVNSSTLIAFMDDINGSHYVANNETITIKWDPTTKIFKL